MRDLSRLFNPSHIAVIGGGAWCAQVVLQCRKMGFKGTLHPVHPRQIDVGGVPSVATIADLPVAPDAVFLGVNRNLTVDLVGSGELLLAGTWTGATLTATYPELKILAAGTPQPFSSLTYSPGTGRFAKYTRITPAERERLP